MDYLDKLIPFSVLIAVGAFLLYILRLAMREQNAQWHDRAPRKSAVIVEPPELAPTVEENRTPAPPAPQGIPRAEPKPKEPAKMPIHAVLDLLKEKDSLAVAFLLREILDKPVSRRRQ